MRIWIDGEWNDYGGELISFACAAEDGREFYAELTRPEHPTKWIAENVIPLLDATPIDYATFQVKLAAFINSFDEPIYIVSDWPEDIERFCAAIIVGPGRSSVYRPLNFRCGLGEYKGAISARPHHALHDARSLRDWACRSSTHRGR